MPATTLPLRPRLAALLLAAAAAACCCCRGTLALPPADSRHCGATGIPPLFTDDHGNRYILSLVHGAVTITAENPAASLWTSALVPIFHRFASTSFIRFHCSFF